MTVDYSLFTDLVSKMEQEELAASSSASGADVALMGGYRDSEVASTSHAHSTGPRRALWLPALLFSLVVAIVITFGVVRRNRDSPEYSRVSGGEDNTYSYSRRTDGDDRRYNYEAPRRTVSVSKCRHHSSFGTYVLVLR